MECFKTPLHQNIKSSTHNKLILHRILKSITTTSLHPAHIVVESNSQSKHHIIPHAAALHQTLKANSTSSASSTLKMSNCHNIRNTSSTRQALKASTRRGNQHSLIASRSDSVKSSTQHISMASNSKSIKSSLHQTSQHSPHRSIASNALKASSHRATQHMPSSHQTLKASKTRGSQYLTRKPRTRSFHSMQLLECQNITAHASTACHWYTHQRTTAHQ